MIREIPIIDFSGFDSDNKKLRNSVAKKVHKAALKAFSFNYYLKKFLFQLPFNTLPSGNVKIPCP